MSHNGRVIVLIVLVVLAGCSFTLDSRQTTSPTPTPGVEQETPSVTPTPNETSPYPPGVEETGLENVSELLEAHTAVLNRTGYVANGSGNTTIRRSGFLIDVSRDVRIVVVDGSRRYFEVRRTRAGPVDRHVQRYSNGSVEFRRHEEDGDVSVRIRELQSAEKLARVDHLESFLLGGNFSVTEVRADDEPTTVVLQANRSDNDTALLSGLPEDAERIRSYNATVVADTDGRVRQLNAVVGFVIGGKNRTHTVSFNLTRIGVTNVSEPDWLDEINESGNDEDERSDRVDWLQGQYGQGGTTVGTSSGFENPRRLHHRAEPSNRLGLSTGPDRSQLAG